MSLDRIIATNPNPKIFLAKGKTSSRSTQHQIVQIMTINGSDFSSPPHIPYDKNSVRSKFPSLLFLTRFVRKSQTPTSPFQYFHITFFSFSIQNQKNPPEIPISPSTLTPIDGPKSPTSLSFTFTFFSQINKTIYIINIPSLFLSLCFSESTSPLCTPSFSLSLTVGSEFPISQNPTLISLLQSHDLLVFVRILGSKVPIFAHSLLDSPLSSCFASFGHNLEIFLSSIVIRRRILVRERKKEKVVVFFLFLFFERRRMRYGR